MMDPENSQMEHLLAQLGKAHREGAFSDAAARYPWRTAEPEATGPARRRFAWSHVAVPLVAAAAVAVVFLGPTLWSPHTVLEVAQNDLAIDALAKPELPASAQPTATTSNVVECDYNGDGCVDGKDIQAFVETVQGTGRDSRREAEYLQRCLLGS